MTTQEFVAHRMCDDEILPIKCLHTRVVLPRVGHLPKIVERYGSAVLAPYLPVQSQALLPLKLGRRVIALSKRHISEAIERLGNTGFIAQFMAQYLTLFIESLRCHKVALAIQ